MAPKAAVENITTQIKGFDRSAHKKVGSRMAMQMSTPPMVGVPAFFWCALGPSSRMYWPIWNSRSFSMTNGPMMSVISSAVSEAKAVRNVRYRKMRKGLK